MHKVVTKRRRTPSSLYPLEERIQLWDDQGRMCHYCDRSIPKPGTKMGRNTQLDHKVPRSQGGSDDLSNLLLSCKVCNREKGKKSYEQFLRDRLEQSRKQVKRLGQLLSRFNNGKG